MADPIVILYFVEDPAQESFISTLISRIAEGEGTSSHQISLSGWAAQDGSRAILEFEQFVRASGSGLWGCADIFVVGFDGNKLGVNERRKQLSAITEPLDLALKDRIVFAIPDPHIERWYLEDQRAFNCVFGPGSAPTMPPYRSSKDYYKQIAHSAISSAGHDSLLGVSPYGEDLALAVDLNVLSRDRGFELFLRDLRAAFKQLRLLNE